MIQFHLDPAESGSSPPPFSVSVIGIGGSGTNVIDKIALEGMPGADLVSLNCDARSLQSSMAGTKIQVGKSLTQGLGCGGDPELGAEAAAASAPEIREMLTGRNMVFLCVGLGGGTGSGAAPMIARMAREAGAFVVVFATLPFAFEGRRRSNQAGLALSELRKYANALVTFENDRMGELVVPKKGVQEAFELADKIIGQSVRAVTSLVTQPGLIHIGMDDLITALRNTDSRCLFGYGQAKGENRAVEALGLALRSPLLDRGQMMTGARNVLVHICGGTTLTLFEIETLMRELGKHVHEDAQILFGAATDAKLNEHLSVTILTSLNKIPVVELPQTPPVEIVPEPVAEPVIEVATPSSHESPAAAIAEPPVAEVAPVMATPQPTPAGRETAPAIATPPAAAAPASEAAPTAAVPLTLDEELFPEIIPDVAPVSSPAADLAPRVIEIPAIVPAREVPAARLTPAAPVRAEEVGFDEPAIPLTIPEPAETPDEPAFEPDWTEAAALVGAEVLTPADQEKVEPDPGPEMEAEPETVPERVIRVERPPARFAIPSPIPEPLQPIPRAAETVSTNRFILRDIIKPKAPPVEPVSKEPLPRYEAQTGYEAPTTPVRPSPAPAPAARRVPDYDRINPIRPIPAGPSTMRPPASPFSPAKPATGKPAPAPAPAAGNPAPAPAPATAPPPVRPVPTQQQTFDQHLQPAGSGTRFERAKPTVEEGEDLDVPTFLRRKR